MLSNFPVRFPGHFRGMDVGKRLSSALFDDQGEREGYKGGVTSEGLMENYAGVSL